MVKFSSLGPLRGSSGTVVKTKNEQNYRTSSQQSVEITRKEARFFFHIACSDCTAPTLMAKSIKFFFRIFRQKEVDTISSGVSTACPISSLLFYLFFHSCIPAAPWHHIVPFHFAGKVFCMSRYTENEKDVLMHSTPSPTPLFNP